MATQTVVPIRSSTQVFTEVETIDRDIAMFVDGSCCLVISASAVNFGLLSEKEQDSMITSYAGLLNSLSFPIQILVRTQHKDITSYLRLLEEQERKQKNPKLAKNIHNYRLFVAATVKEKDVLDKKFYIIIPFSSLELGASANVLFGSKKKGLPYPRSYILERALTVLLPKRDHVIRLMTKLGVQAKHLTSDQLIKLFFTAYNPDVPPPDTETIEKAVGH